MSRPAVLTGGCQCGAVRYALFAEPDGGLCHCRMCQRAVGGPFAALTGVALHDFAWTRGQPRVYASSSIARREFCGDCGTPLTFAYNHRARTSVTAGSLDDPERANVHEHFGVESQLTWLQLCDDWPRERTDEAADDSAALLATMTVFQDEGR